MVDRLELEDQAAEAFKDYLKNDFRTVIYKENRDDWRSAEIVVSTVQSLLSKNRYKRRFKPDDFQLIIKVLKLMKRNDVCKLVIESDTADGFVIFGDCLPDAKKIKSRKIRKGPPVFVRGRLRAFGSAAVNSSNCRLR